MAMKSAVGRRNLGRVREQPEQQAPPVQRLRIRYAKRGRLRFSSHRDFSRAFERAIFRARIPMAYSSGFNPHPRISYAGAAPTGSASEAEYLEIGLAEVVDPAAIQAALEEALPDGLDVVAVVESPGRRARRPAAGQPLVGRHPGARSRRRRPRSQTFLGDRVGAGPADDQEGAARVRLPLGGAVARRRPGRAASRGPGAASTWCCGTPSRRSDPTTCSPVWLRWPASSSGDHALLTRLAQGPLDEATGEIGDPLTAPAVTRSCRPCAILAMVDPSEDPDRLDDVLA